MPAGSLIASVTVLVPDYDAGIAFFVDALGFDLVEDTWLTASKRWVRVRPPGAAETCLLLAVADTPDQKAALGRQCGGRVGFFLHTAHFDRDHARFVSAGVRFREQPRREVYGTVAVFEDPWGNPWDLIGPA
jgi:catechol 2,3-dioxygenase-like lactoylglutathione lyase family enzyme